MESFFALRARCFSGHKRLDGNEIQSTKTENDIRALIVCERMDCWRSNDLRSPCGWIEFEGIFGKGIDRSNCKRR